MSDTKNVRPSVDAAMTDDKPRRRSSVVDAIASGFRTVNLVKPLPTVSQGLEPQTGSTTLASRGLNSYYRPADHLEGLHRYDEETRLVRKLVYRICSFACLMFFALQLDRGNISQALSDNMPKVMLSEEYGHVSSNLP
jgi:hypothetical protein